MMKKKEVLERASYCWSEDSIRMILTPGSTARTTYFYAQELGYFKTVYPYFTERQNLDSFLIIYTLSGQGTLQYGGRTYCTNPGQCIYIHCNDHHLYQAPEGAEWEFLWIHFNGPGALGYYREFVKNGFDVVNCKEHNLMVNTLWRLIALHKKRDLTTELQSSRLITSLLTELLIETCTGSPDTFLIPGFIKDIARDIDKNYKSDLPLSYFEKKYHRSKYYLIREFKKYMGVTITESIILARIACAKELLKYSDLPVSEVADACGMNQSTHFINLFKSREGITPLAYRKAWTG